MLKNLLLSEWFHVQPYSKYVVMVMLIAPLMAASAHSTSAQLQAAKNSSVTQQSESVSIGIVGGNENQVLSATEFPVPNQFDSVQISRANTIDEAQILQLEKIDSWTAEANSLTVQIPDHDSLAVVELAPPKVQSDAVSQGLSDKQSGLVQKLKDAKVNFLARENSYVSINVPAAGSSQVAKVIPLKGQSQPNFSEVPVVEQPNSAEVAQQDPIGSPHPIPWEWIMNTHQAISSKGGSGVRHYRSIPVVSPDGRYAVYSRVQLEVKPELYNSRVSSVLFVEDRQTGKMRVVSSTSRNMDTLLRAKTSQDPNGEGTIGVLVPVSWSEKGDRFLARRFEAVFNTSDASDSAVIWDRQNNNTKTVAPAHKEDEHEKIAILLGWSKTQPGHVLFRAGELGQEDWPVMAVSNEGRTVLATDVDQPVTFGEKVKTVWADPQVAYR